MKGNGILIWFDRMSLRPPSQMIDALDVEIQKRFDDVIVDESGDKIPSLLVTKQEFLVTDQSGLLKDEPCLIVEWFK